MELLLVPALFNPVSFAAEPSPLPVIVVNDNRTPAGNLNDCIQEL
jgi:hypothetical protein